jgi:hypothetical protein
MKRPFNDCEHALSVLHLLTPLAILEAFDDPLNFFNIAVKS